MEMLASTGRVCWLSPLPARPHGIRERSRTWRPGHINLRNPASRKVSEGLGLRGVRGRESLVCRCNRNSGEEDEETTDGFASEVEAFCRLPSTVSWGTGEVASTMFIFWTGLHIPLGLAGLDIVAKVFPQQFPDPQTQAVSVVCVQLLELAGTIWLIQSTLQPFGPLPDCFSFRFTEVWKNRGWLPASATGLVVLLVAVAAAASFTEDVSTAEVGSGTSALTTLLINCTPLARMAIYAAYCRLTPCLEEYVYRGFLLSSLRKYMRWPFAVIVSALVFSLSHFSAPGLLPLFWVGCCLGMAYAWTGNLASSFVIHSVYNAIVLTRALLY